MVKVFRISLSNKMIRWPFLDGISRCYNLELVARRNCDQVLLGFTVFCDKLVSCNCAHGLFGNDPVLRRYVFLAENSN